MSMAKNAALYFIKRDEVDQLREEVRMLRAERDLVLLGPDNVEPEVGIQKPTLLEQVVTGFQERHQGLFFPSSLRVRRRRSSRACRHTTLPCGAAHLQKYPTARASLSLSMNEWGRKFWGDASLCYYLLVLRAVA